MRKLSYILLIVVLAACKEKFELPYSGPPLGYLVVEGTINGGVGPTNIRLSRALGLVDSVMTRNETQAMVWVEGENNTQFPLAEVAPGFYQHAQLSLQQGEKYRLRIQTSDGKAFHSDFIEYKKTPDIDAISWERNDQGVQLYINTHDDTESTHYYRWEYEETWEFHSAFNSLLQYRYINDEPVEVIDRPGSETQAMYTCWANDRSTNIHIGSSVKLSRDTIHLPLLFIPDGSWKISVKYSILVRQYAVSAAGFDFLQRMKRNTEQVGSLFDAQPSELTGNIVCEDDPRETVIGFVEVSELKTKRLFISRGEVNPWNYLTGCYEESILNMKDSINAGLIPTRPDIMSPSGRVVRFFASTPMCVDCRLRGVNVKPDFWQ